MSTATSRGTEPPIRLRRAALLSSVPTRLSPELEAEAARRLGAMALVVSAVTGVMHVAEVAYRPQLALAMPWRTILVALSVLGALALHLAVARRAVAPRRALDLGTAYEIANGLVLGILFHSSVLIADAGFGAWPPVAVWVLVYPLVVPTAPRRVVLASLATALMDAVSIAVDGLAGGARVELAAYVQQLVPTFMAAVIAPVASSICYGLTMEVSRAREMGAYRLVERLGRGGMGEVWRAEHRMLARPAAIKLIRLRDAGLDGPSYAREMAKRFEREAKATAMLRSPHTIVVYDYGAAEDGTFHYVMELLEGYSLQSLVARFGPVPPERAVHLLVQACRSLEEAHAAGLVHRDIKPANLFTCRLGVDVDFVKVLDFGLVKVHWPKVSGAENLTREGTFTGTPAYMPPEVALGAEPIDGRADIYALGCVGYWLLTGQRVFESSNAMQMVIDHVRTQPVAVSRRARQPIPAALERILMSCLEKDANDRPACAHDLARQLTSLGLSESWTQDRARGWWLQNPPAGNGGDGDGTETVARGSVPPVDRSSKLGMLQTA